MNFEIPIPPRPEKNDRHKNTKENGLTRREFLKTGAVIGAAVLAGLDLSGDEKQSPEKIQPTEPEKNSKEKVKNSETIKKEDDDVIGQTFRQQLEKGPHITLGKATRQAIFDNWYQRYSPGTIEYQEGIVEGLERMHPWIEDIRKVFAEFDVPEEFAYLAIAESNFRMHDVSEKNATGPYQIVANLKKLETQLIINKDRDERLDPVRSAEFCADHLATSYKKFRENWNLAFLAYNGGFTADYLDDLPQREQEIPKDKITTRGTYTIKAGDTYSEIAEKFETSESLLWKLNCDSSMNYEEWHNCIAQPGKELIIPQKRKIDEEDFYQWMEKKINKILEDELQSSFYVIKEGDTLEALAKVLRMELSYLKSLNLDVDEKNLKPKQKINTPKLYKNNVDYFLFILSNSKENINYPGKFNAILKIIEENRLRPRPGEFQMRYDKINLKQEITLTKIAEIKKISLENLKIANPSILNPQAPLEKDTVIRLPRHFHLGKEKDKRKIG